MPATKGRNPSRALSLDGCRAIGGVEQMGQRRRQTPGGSRLDGCRAIGGVEQSTCTGGVYQIVCLDGCRAIGGVELTDVVDWYVGQSVSMVVEQ